ncbi:hypothetical protein FISHEDRAFT_72761 [Fistulina hepatica ATCC 64428]|nr:hypothetical protein FISHEDRAFT_72761 [Fistulina hepatica ATCC 64428]
MNHSVVARNALDEVKRRWKLSDGWRRANPDAFAYSHVQDGTGVQSRIDRIYVTDEVLQNCAAWNIEPCEIRSDHLLVSVDLANTAMPERGKGRPTFKLYALANKKVSREINAIGEAYLQDLAGCEARLPETTDVQVRHEKFKNDLLQAASNYAKKTKPIIKKKIEDTKVLIELNWNDSSIDDDEKILTGALLQHKVDELYALKLTSDSAASKTAAKILGEKVNKTWPSWGRESSPRDELRSLEKPGAAPLQYVSKSLEMAELARDYHNNLQNADLDRGLHEDRARIIEEVISTIPGSRKVTQEQKASLSGPFLEEEVRSALYQSKNGKAAGLDGVQYEVYKTLDQRYVQAKKRREREGSSEAAPQNGLGGFDVRDTLVEKECHVEWKKIFVELK